MAISKYTAKGVALSNGLVKEICGHLLTAVTQIFAGTLPADQRHPQLSSLAACNGCSGLQIHLAVQTSAREQALLLYCPAQGSPSPTQAASADDTHAAEEQHP